MPLLCSTRLVTFLIDMNKCPWLMVLGDKFYLGGKSMVTDHFAGNKNELLKISSDQKTKERQ